MGGVGDMQLWSGDVAIDDWKESYSPSSAEAWGVYAHHAMGVYHYFIVAFPMYNSSTLSMPL